MCCLALTAARSANINGGVSGNTINTLAVDALSSAVHTAPSLMRTSRVLGGLCLCEWHTPAIEGFELPETDDLILALHRGGSHEVRALRGGRPSRNRSTPGLFSLIPPGRRVAYKTGGQVSFATMHVSRAALQELAGEALLEPLADRFAFSDPFLYVSVASLLREARSPDRWTPRFVEAVTQALLLQLLRNATVHQTEAVPAKSGIAYARQTIEERIDGKLSVEALASEAGLSRAHFSRVFRRATGEAPHRFIIERRVERAKQMLRDSALTLAEIADANGFCSQSHFTRVFRLHTGMTPHRYRQQQ